MPRLDEPVAWGLAALLAAGCTTEFPIGLLDGGPGSDGGGGFPLSGRGYVPRPCGFDLDGDGLPGEPADCRVCDGATADPDGDGVREDLAYVDCESGTDDDACGAPDAPCATLEHAWTVRTDGPEDGAEDVVCFRGDCSPESLQPRDGAPGAFTRVAAGDEVRDFEYPADPAMLVGWDSDGDGEYPPHDPDDRAVLDGSGGRSFALVLSSRVEIAHFSVVDYGRFVETPGGLLQHAAEVPLSHVYVHDLSVRDVVRQRPYAGGVSVLYLGDGSPELSFVAVENLEVTSFGGSLVRRVPRAPDGPYRFRNVGAVASGCRRDACDDSEAGVTFFDLAGGLTGVEILDCRLDADPNPWDAAWATAFNVGTCAQDVTIRGNEAWNFTAGLEVSAWTGGECGDAQRSVDEVLFDANELRETTGRWWDGFTGVRLRVFDPGGASATIEDVTISNNLLWAPGGFRACIFTSVGRPDAENPGAIRIVGNTCEGPLTPDFRGLGVLVLRADGAATSAFPQQRFVVKDNVFAGQGVPAQRVLDTAYEPSGWDSDFNVYGPEAEYLWAASPYDLDGLRAATGGDASSSECVPEYADAYGGDFHLAAGDTCARDTGTDVSTITRRDLDGDARPQGAGWDRGADEAVE